MRSVESALEGKDCLVADRFTIADMAVGYALVLASSLEIDEAFTPNVQTYWDRINARPTFQRANDI